jgi:hypothetical protein
MKYVLNIAMGDWFVGWLMLTPPKIKRGQGE